VSGRLGRQQEEEHEQQQTRTTSEQPSPRAAPAADDGGRAHEEENNINNSNNSVAGGGDECTSKVTFGTWNAQSQCGNIGTRVELVLRHGGYGVIGVCEVGAVSDSLADNGELNATLASNNMVGAVKARADGRGTRYGGSLIAVRSDKCERCVPIVVEPAWSAVADIAAVDVVLKNGERVAFFNIYAHCCDEASTDEAFLTLRRALRWIRTAYPSAVVMGDLNCALKGPHGGSPRRVPRAAVFREELLETGWSLLNDDRATMARCSNVNDYIIVSPEAMRVLLLDADSPAEVVTDLQHGSDHNPVRVSALVLSRGAAQARRQATKRNICWSRVDDAATEKYNTNFRRILARQKDRGWVGPHALEHALLMASRCLPRVRGDPQLAHGLWWTRQELAELNALGAAAAAEKVKQRRHAVLQQGLARSANPSACWSTFRRFYRGRDAAARPDIKDPRAPDDPAATASTNEAKAALLAREYARMHTIDGANVRAGLRRELASMAGDGARKGAPVALWELDSAIDELNMGCCADALGIKAELLRMLDAESRAAMLPCVSRTVCDSIIPKHWKTAITTPVPKARKDHATVKGWRPVSVTAVLCRMCESIVYGRIARRWEQCARERPATRAQSQFGFRKGIGTNLATLSLAAFIDHGCRSRTEVPVDAAEPGPGPGPAPRHRGRARGARRANHQHITLFVSVDCDSAFCRANGATAVRRIRHSLGLTAEARWVAEFLSERKMIVKVDDARADPVDLDSGVPQGTILGPLLWSLCVEDLLLEIEQDARGADADGTAVLPVTFADDINFAVQGIAVGDVVRRAQRLLGIINAWSRRSGIPIGSLKATWIGAGAERAAAESADARLSCCGIEVAPALEEIRLLGVHFDSEFTFDGHVTKILQTAWTQLATLEGLAFVAREAQLRVMYHGLVLSVLLFNCETWYPYISAESRDRLERAHARGCAIITGCVEFSIDRVKILREAGFRSFECLAHERMAKTGEKLHVSPLAGEPPSRFGVAWLHCALFGAQPTVADPLPRLGVGQVPLPAGARRVIAACDRTTVRSFNEFRDVPRLTSPALHYDNATLTAVSSRAPPGAFVTAAPGGLCKWTASRDELAAANRAVVDAVPADTIRVFVDGSVEMSSLGGRGSAASAFSVRWRGAVVHEGAVPAGVFTCSYGAEQTAIIAALEWLAANRARFPRAVRVCVFSDSQGSIAALRRGPLRTSDEFPALAWSAMARLALANVWLSFRFVFSHCGLDENEAVDKLVNESRASLGDEDAPLWRVDATRHSVAIIGVDYDAANMYYPSTSTPLQVGPARSLKHLSLPRQDEILLFHARVGFMVELDWHLHDASARCPLCGVAAPGRHGGSIEHLFFECSARQANQCPPEGAICMWTNPAAAISYLRRLQEAKQHNGRVAANDAAAVLP